jgi:hypothetical protein
MQALRYTEARPAPEFGSWRDECRLSQEKVFMMVRRSFAVLAVAAATAACCLVLGTLSSDGWAAGKAKRPLKTLKHDPNAEEVALFEAIEAGQLEVRVLPKNAFGGNVLIENKTDKPLTVKMPAAVGAVPKHLAQFGGGFGGGGLGGGGLGGGGLGGGQGGGQQQLGGGLGGGGLGGGGLGGGGMGGGGFFGGGGGGFGSIPPEQIASIPLNSVCLEHGKPEPSTRSEYVLVPIEKLSDDPVLHGLLELVGTGKVDAQAAQAATWHLANNMTFDQLANKAVQHVGGLPATPYFTQNQLLGAQALLAHTRKAVEEAPAQPAKKPEVRSGRVAESAAAKK